MIRPVGTLYCDITGQLVTDPQPRRPPTFSHSINQFLEPFFNEKKYNKVASFLGASLFNNRTIGAVESVTSSMEKLALSYDYDKRQNRSPAKRENGIIVIPKYGKTAI